MNLIIGKESHLADGSFFVEICVNMKLVMFELRLLF